MKSLRERLQQFDAAPRSATERARPATEALLEAEPRFERLPGGALRLVLERPELPQPDALDAEIWRLFSDVERRPPLPWIVFDCETTGLEGGAGSFVFLLGWVEWRATGSRCVQLFLPEPAAEPDMLDAFEGALGEAGALLSYNGKSFDLPRLRSRHALQRRAFGAEELPHMDLLHPCRRASRDWVEDGRLATMERVFLDKERHDDLPGAEVPDVYRAFLRGDADAPILRVLEHNRRDVLHLCELAATMAQLFKESDPLPAAARLAIARLYESRGELVHARRRYDELRSVRGEVGRRALWQLGHLLKRQKDFAAASARFRELVRREPSVVRGRIELAKLLEHRLSDASAARREVLAALDALERGTQLGRVPPAGGGAERQALHHRLRRLERKCGSPL